MKNLFLLLLFFALLASACSFYKNDKCWIDDKRYEQAKKLYDKTSSLEMVKQTLKDDQWRRCEINEAVYRLKKQLQLHEQ